MPASFSHPKPSCCKRGEQTITSEGYGSIQDGPFHPWDRIPPFPRGVRRASSQASIQSGWEPGVILGITLTGMRTVFIPNSPKRWTSAWVNQVRQCLSKIWSAVFGYFLVRALLVRSDSELPMASNDFVDAQFGRNTILATVAYFTTHADPFWLRISFWYRRSVNRPMADHLGASKVPSTTCEGSVTQLL